MKTLKILIVAAALGGSAPLWTQAPALGAQSLGEGLGEASAAASSFKAERTKRRGSRRADIEAGLKQALALRQSIRRLLRANGVRVTRELLAETHAEKDLSGNINVDGFQGSILWGLAKRGELSAAGSLNEKDTFDQQTYQSLVKGGELFIVTSIDPASLAAFEKAVSSYQEGLNCPEVDHPYDAHPCPGAMLAKFRQLDRAAAVSEIKARIKDFGAALDALEPLVAFDADPQGRSIFADLKSWGQGSQIEFLTARNKTFNIYHTNDGSWRCGFIYSAGYQCLDQTDLGEKDLSAVLATESELVAVY